MVTVPTFENLPQVAPVAPEVRPQQQLDRFQRQQMGAPGEALEGMGKAVEGAGMDATRISDAMAQQQNEDIAKAAATQHQQYVNNLLFTSADGQGGPGLFALKGQAAVDAAPSVLAAITAQRDQATNGMTQQAKNAYVNQTNTQIAAATETVQRHTMLQAADAATSTSQARIQTATDTGTLNYNDPATLAASAQTIHSEAADQARRQGWLPNADGTPSVQQTVYEKAQLSKMYAGAIDNAHAKGDTLGAASLLQNYGSQMDGAANVRAQDMLKPGLLKIHAQQQGDSLIGPQASAGGDDQSLPRGLRNNNPLNLEGGDTATDGRFGQYPTMEAGVAANAKQLLINQDTHGLTTIAGQIGRWSPTSDPTNASGSTANYIKSVSTEMGMGPNDKLDLHDPGTMGRMVTAMARVENGGKTPDQDAIGRGVATATGTQFAGPGVPTAASVAAQKPPRPDFEGAIGRVPDTPNDPDLHNATVGYINERKNVYDMGETIQRKKLDETTIPQTLQAMENGAVDTMVPELAIRQSHNEAESDQIMSKFADARQFGTLLNANKYASPDDINAQITALHAKAVGTVVPAEPPDLTGKFNTPLTAAEQPEYEAWLKAKGIDSAKATFDYDMQGAFKAQAAQADNGHFPDTFKKPNHPTFSDQSQYSTARTPGGTWAQNGDKWEFKASPYNLTAYSASDLQNYFATREPGSTVTLPPATSAADIAQAVKGETMLTAVLAKRQEQLKADPWSYVRQEPSVAAAYSGNMKDPANAAAAIARSMAVQTHLGAEPQSIATDSINKNVSDIHAAAPSAVPGMMDNLKGQYGSAWPTVFHDLVAKGKLDPDYQTLATMPTGSPGRVDFAAALTAKADKGEKFGAAAAANTDGAKATIEQRITTDLGTFQNSFQGSSGDGAIEGYRNSVRTLATFYADRGMDPTQAAKTAYTQVLGNTDVSGFIRAPKTLNGQPFSAQKVLDAGDGVTRGLTDAALQGGVTAAQAKQGSWATNPDGMGATLLVQNASGSWRMVRRTDGAPVQIDYRALPAVTASPQAPDAPFVAPTMQQGSLSAPGNTQLAGDVIPFVNPARGHLPGAETPDEFEERLRRNPLGGAYRGGRPASTEAPVVSPEGEG